MRSATWWCITETGIRRARHGGPGRARPPRRPRPAVVPRGSRASGAPPLERRHDLRIAEPVVGHPACRPRLAPPLGTGDTVLRIALHSSSHSVGVPYVRLEVSFAASSVQSKVSLCDG